MKDKIGIIILIIGIFIFGASIVLGHFQTNALVDDNQKIQQEIDKVQTEIDKLKESDDTISKSEAVNTKDLAEQIATTQSKLIAYYPKMVTNALNKKEIIDVSSLCDSFYSQVNAEKPNDVNLFVEHMWYYNPNFKATYVTMLNYAPGKVVMLWKIQNGDKLAGVVTAEYNSETQLISNMKAMLNKYGKEQNTKFKGYPKQEREKDTQDKPESLQQEEDQQAQEAQDTQNNNSDTEGVESDD